MGRYIRFYRSNPDILLLHIFEFVVYFAAWFAEVAIYTLLIELGAPPYLIALITAMNFLPALLISPFSGVLIDIVDAKKLLLVLALVQVVTTFFMIFIDSYELIPLLGVLLFIKMATASIHFQTDMTVVAKIVPKDSLHIANEIQAAIWSFCYSAGMAISGFYVATFGIAFTFMSDIVIILAAIPLLFFIRFPKSAPRGKQKLKTMLKEGFLYTIGSKKIRYIILMHGIIGFMIIDVLVTLLAGSRFKEIMAVSVAIGLMNAAKAVGLTIGAPLLGRFVNDDNLWIYFFAIGASFILWGLFFIEGFYSTLFMLVFIGIFSALLWAYTYTMLQKNVEDRFLGRTLAYNDMVFMFFGVVATLGIGFLYELGVSLSLIAVVIGAIFALNGAVYKRVGVQIVKGGGS